MSFPRYPKYKASGGEWLGDVPQHWEVKVLKHIVSIPITDGPHETPDFPDEGIPFVSAEAVATGVIDFTKIRGFIWTAGRVNFLSDPSSEMSMTQLEFAKAIGVSVATISAKSRDIWDGLDLIQFDPDYTIASRMDSNPLIWMIEVDGLIVDLRSAAREMQEAAFEQGLIPYVPADRDTE